jgi:cell division septation protein DedD
MRSSAKRNSEWRGSGMLREGDQVKAAEDINRAWYESGRDVEAGQRGIVVDEHHSLFEGTRYDVTFDRGLGRPETVEEVREEQIERHQPFFEYHAPKPARDQWYRPPQRSSDDPLTDFFLSCLAFGIAVAAIVAAIYAAGVVLAGVLWAPVVGLETVWPDGSVGGYYFAATICLAAIGAGIWLAGGLRRPAPSTGRRVVRIAASALLIVSALVLLFAVLPPAVRAELREQAARAAAESTVAATSARPERGSSDVDREATSAPAKSKAASAPLATSRKGPDEWPARRDGFTVQLASMTSADEAPKVARAAEAAGLDAGILYSSHYPDLRPGFFVVYAGIFDTRAEADAQLAAGRAVRPDAFIQWVSPAGHDRPAPYPAVAGEEPATDDGEVTAPPATGEFELTEAARFAVEAPLGWVLVEEDIAHGPFHRTEWRETPDSETYVFVDYAPQHPISPQEAGERARSKTSDGEGYEEVFFGATRANEQDAWKWVYRLGDRQVAHYFMQACGTAYAVRGAAPAQTFSSYEPIFSHVADTLAPRC